MRTPGLWLSALLLPLLAACGASSSTSVTAPTTSRCAVSAQTAQKTIAAAGGTGSVSVDTARECQWSATADAPWLSIMSGGSGQGAGSLTFSAAANASVTMRVGRINVNDQHVEVTQEAAVCDYTVAPAEISTAAAGGDLRVTVTTAAFCAWTAVPRAPWISVSAADGTGTTELTLRVATNTGPSRSGAVEIGGRTITVSQEAGTGGPAPQCTYVVSPSSVSIDAGGGSSTLTVTATEECSWSISGVPSWIAITGTGGSGGNGTVTLNIGANTGAARSATLTVAGQTVTVTQAAANSACAYSIAPTSFSVTAAGGSTTVAVTTSSDCAWSTSGAPDWIVITSGSGTGNGSVTIAAQPNTGAPRTAMLTIAGQTFQMDQAGTCAYVINPATYAPTAAGGSIEVTVTTTGACAWNTSNAPGWVSVTGGSGTGSGKLTVTVQPNTGNTRSATLTIAGQAFTITQEAAPCSFTVSPTTLQVSNNGGTQTFTVTTATYCTWTAAVTTGGTWLTITSGATGAGNGSVQVSVDRNRDPARSGTLTIAGKLVTINQDAK
jgi:hypothetical protein